MRYKIMRRRTWAAVLVLGLLGGALAGAPAETNPPPESAALDGRDPAAPVPAGVQAQPSAAHPSPQAEFGFPVGETLVYSVHWGFLHVGETRVWNEWIEEDGRRLLAIRARIQTVSVLDKIFPVDDFLESVVDPQTFLPLRFTRRLSEGRYRLHEVTTFDHAALRAHWKHLLRKDSEEDFAIESNTRDMISFMFYMRRHAWQPDIEFSERVMANEKLYDLIVQTRQYEKIKLPAYGSVRSLLVEPDAKFQGVFLKVGRLRVWISDDQRCLCTVATAKIPVGTVRVMLQRVEGPGDDHWRMPGKTDRHGEDD